MSVTDEGAPNLSPLVFSDRAGVYQVEFSQLALKGILNLCAGSRGVEVGGILIGRYLGGDVGLLVSEGIGPPQDSISGPSSFERGTHGLAELLAERWAEDPRKYYVGEWHYHTDAVPWPSHQDLRQMRLVSQDPQYQCANPILLVVSQSGESLWTPTLYAFEDGDPVQLTMGAADQLAEDLR